MGTYADDEPTDLATILREQLAVQREIAERLARLERRLDRQDRALLGAAAGRAMRR